MAAGLLLGPWIFDADGNGAPFVGGLLTTYLNRTTTPQATYTTAALSVPLANPIVADGNGRFPDIWADTAETFSIKWTKPDGTLIATYDDRQPLGQSDSAAFALVDLSNVTPANVLAAAEAANVPSSFRNRLFNPLIRFDQRNAGGTLTLGSGAASYGPDRWCARRIVGASGSPAATLQQSTGGPPINGPDATSYCVIYAVTTGATRAATDQAYVEQPIEGVMLGDALLGQAGAAYLAIRFWINSQVPGKYSGYLQNSDRSRSYVFTFNIDVSASWQEITAIIPGDQAGTWLADTGVGLRFGIDMGCGSNFEGAAGAWAGADRRRTSDSVALSTTSAKQCVISRAQLTPVSGATLNPSFELRPEDDERRHCQRYYQAFPGTGVSSGAGPGGTRLSTAQLFSAISLPVPMRAAPTLYNPGPVGWAGAAPTTSGNIAFVSVTSNAYLAITGALTLAVPGGFGSVGNGPSNCTIVATAGTSFGGSAGENGIFVIGSAAILGLTAELT